MNEPSSEHFPVITDAGLDDLRKRIGVRITKSLEPWCYEATRDNIRHYAHGIGDDNPLWCDPEYASNDALRWNHRPTLVSICLRLDNFWLLRWSPWGACNVGWCGLDVVATDPAQRRGPR